MSREILQNIIDNFDIPRLRRFFSEKNNKFRPSEESFGFYDNDNFSDGIKLGDISFDDGTLLVYAFKVKQELSERSGKKAQYELGKKILKETQTDAGIFIYYNQAGSFRFSLIYANYLGKKRDWSTFRRFTYFVGNDLTNKTFKQRIGDSDFSNLAKIKDAFSVEKVTKEFYESIANWYFWAVEHCQFPKDAEAEENGRNIAVIRLITRMIFIWFMRERGLVPKDLFDNKTIGERLKSLSPNESTYYRAILQNLFFATLSTPKSKREFTDEKRFDKGFNEDFGNHSLFRYYECFKDQSKLRNYFNEVPFLNGGLFECLDSKEERIYIDGFSRTKKNQPNVPNFLFFSQEQNVDLNTAFGTKNKNYKVRGLLDILSSFNFTIDENSPDDQDIALDPELLGRVFENLLASFNPETSTTARKATGSYYTPREIVDYMVTESLKAYFKTHLSDIDSIDKKVENLFSTGGQENPFDKTESKKLIDSIESVRIVDPAVGSGAFPMGVLNKLVFILNKVDPDNELWKQAQLKASDAIPDPSVRREAKTRIEEFFQGKNADYGRKLYLIQKCIYGVDIQQIAVEIAKLRFFISLLVDEKIDKTKENWGIEPLPNLDFKIMQGNSLISEFLGIDFDNDQEKQNMHYGQFEFGSEDQEDVLIKEFERKKIDYQNEPDKEKKANFKAEVENLMIKLFEAKLQKKYAELKPIEERAQNIPNLKTRGEYIRIEKEKFSKKHGFDLENIEKQLREFTSKKKTRPFFPWKLYFAEVFETGGFDIVIANPPYVRQEEISYKSALQKEYEIFNSVSDLYTYFYEKGFKLLKKSGVLTFITSNKFLRARYGTILRKYLQTNTAIKSIVNFGDQHVFEAITNTLIFIATKQKAENNNFNYSNNIIEVGEKTFPQDKLQDSEWTIDNPEIICLKNKIEREGTPLKDWGIQMFRGLLTGYNEAYIIDTSTKDKLCKQDKQNHSLIKPIIRGRDVEKYYHRNSGLYLITIHNGYKLEDGSKVEAVDIKDYPVVKAHLDQYRDNLKERQDKGETIYNLRDCAFMQDFTKEKIIWIELTDKNRFSYSDKEEYILAGAFMMTGKSLKFLLAFLNSKLCLFYFSLICNSSGMATTQWKKFALEKVPVKELSEKEQKPFIEIVDKILAITKSDDYLQNEAKQKKVKEYENQIDQRVYKLYNLTPEEIKIVENSSKN